MLKFWTCDQFLPSSVAAPLIDCGSWLWSVGELCELGGPLTDTRPDEISLSKGRVTRPPNLSPLTLRHTTPPPLLTPPIPIRPAVTDRYQHHTLCWICLGPREQLRFCCHIFVRNAHFNFQRLCLLFFLMPNRLLILPHSSPICLLLGMSHEPKSPSLGMISTATRTTATVSPLTPSPLNGSIVANGSPATQSAHSGFAAALRKLAKQAEEPRGKTRKLI